MHAPGRPEARFKALVADLAVWRRCGAKDDMLQSADLVVPPNSQLWLQISSWNRGPAPRPHRRWRGDGEAASHCRGKCRQTHARICLFCEARQAAGHHAGSDFVSSCRHQKTGEAIGWRERRVGAAAKVRWRRSSVLAREEPGGVASARATRGTRTRESAACRRNGGGGSKSRG
jgi:hypothetical protein